MTDPKLVLAHEEHTEFSIVDHGGIFSCIPSQLLAEVNVQEEAKRLVGNALDAGEVTLNSVDAIAGSDEDLRVAVRGVIMMLLKNQFDYGVDDEWDLEDLWEILTAHKVVEGEIPEGWQPSESDLRHIPVLELEWLWAPSDLLSADWSQYLPSEVLELAEFNDSMLHGDQMWFPSESLELVTATLSNYGYKISRQ